MTDAVVLFAEHVTATVATDTNFVDTAVISAASFEASTEYIIMAVCSARHASSANLTRAQLVHKDPVPQPFDDNVWEAWEGTSNTQHHQVQWLARFTQPSTRQDIAIRIASSSTTDVTNDYSAIIAFKASDLGTENTDWFWNEDTVDYTGTATPTAKASETFTPNGTDRWIVAGQAAWINDVSIATQVGFELHDGTSVLKLTSQEGEDVTDQLSQMLVWAGIPTNSSKTYSVRLFNSGGNTFQSNRIFALNLSRFDVSAHHTDAAEVTPATAASWANVANISPTPSAQGDFVVIGQTVGDMNNTADDLRMRMQINPSGGGLASDPAYGDDSPGQDSWDAVDEVSWMFLKLVVLNGAAARDINIDAQTAAAANARVEDRTLVAFSVALAGPPPERVPFYRPMPQLLAH